MKGLIAAIAVLLSASAAQALTLPDIYVEETPNAQGGAYTVYIFQPDLTESSPWYLLAWGITNEEATGVNTGLTGWSSWLIDAPTWDSGIFFEIGTPGDPVPLFTSGDAGIGSFANVFGEGSQAAFYYLESYIGFPGLVATSSNFEWFDGPPSSSAFAIIANADESTDYWCPIGVGSSSPLSCTAIAPIPVPAAVWLFGSALGLLGWIRRRAA